MLYLRTLLDHHCENFKCYIRKPMVLKTGVATREVEHGEEGLLRAKEDL
jgi:hypothetical protein